LSCALEDSALWWRCAVAFAGLDAAQNLDHNTGHVVNGTYHSLGTVREIWVQHGENQELAAHADAYHPPAANYWLSCKEGCTKIDA